MKFEIIARFFRTSFADRWITAFFAGQRETGLIEVSIHDLREFTSDKHRTVDDRPFGGGEGMVLKPEPIFECIEKLGIAARDERAGRKRVKDCDASSCYRHKGGGWTRPWRRNWQGSIAWLSSADGTKA